MINTTKTTIFDVVRTVHRLEQIHKYMVIILYSIGICGACLNIITFLQKQLRINPCGVYFFSTSLIDFGIMNVYLLIEIIEAFNKPLSNTIQNTRFWCKTGKFLKFIFPCLSSTYLTLASFDRFCISSSNPKFRQWTNLKISRLVVSSVFIIWTLVGLHIPIFYDLIYSSSFKIPSCQVMTSLARAILIIDDFVFSIFNGIVIPFILTIFGLLIYYNIKQSRSRVHFQPMTATTISTTFLGHRTRTIHHRRSSHMLFMLLVQVFSTVILNIPFIIIYLLTYTDNLPKDLSKIRVFYIFKSIGLWFYYMNYCKTFYINTLTSRLFRESLCQQFRQFFSLHY
ncbi:hypothetical protein I4U23_026463 [Adineta vaga]|nr:hypothetical protein I4U23_026463 [Adineta vaga]